MGARFQRWIPRSQERPKDYESLKNILHTNRKFQPVNALEYGDYGLEQAFHVLSKAIRDQKRIALYADYDVDGTMSCVSWIWFFQAIGFANYTHYIPDRFREGYGVNLTAVQHLVRNEKADVIITMDTGITANEEASWCKAHGVEFICTDHHKIQPTKMPDCVILNPKSHPSPDYQELCGAGITFVLLRKLGQEFRPDPSVWHDILALTGMATICDVVPLNGVNHKLAQLGVQSMLRSNRVIFRKLLDSSRVDDKNLDERDIGFRLGPRINAVGRLDHAHKVVEAFLHERPEMLIQYMGHCNDERKRIQDGILKEANLEAQGASAPILFLGGHWHQGVVGIAASRIAETYWKPTWLFDRGDTLCKGSARSIAGFDVTEAMMSCGDLFLKYGGHRAAGGFSFLPKNETLIREALETYARGQQTQYPSLWDSEIRFDCELDLGLMRLDLCDVLGQMRPFGHQFEEPLFKINAEILDVKYFNDKTSGLPKHTCVHVRSHDSKGGTQKILFFNEVYSELEDREEASFLVTVSRNTWQGKTSLTLMGSDFA